MLEITIEQYQQAVDAQGADKNDAKFECPRCKTHQDLEVTGVVEGEKVNQPMFRPINLDVEQTKAQNKIVLIEE